MKVMDIQNKIALLKHKKQGLTLKETLNNTELSNGTTFASKLNDLKAKNSYPTHFFMSDFAIKVRLIIMIDISSSMIGTEENILEGLRELCSKHIQNDILFSLVVFNEKIRVVYKDMPISSVTPELIVPNGWTNLNGALYKTIANYDDNNNIHNLFVAISDGNDTENKIDNENENNRVMPENVAALIKSKSKYLNDFYFLGEAHNFESLEEVFQRACQLGFNRNNIEVFTRLEEGNKLNFQVISNMLDDLLQSGEIRANWSEPIKEHYLSLVDKKMRR